MTSRISHWTRLKKATALLGLLVFSPLSTADVLKISYSDWPGWVAWDIALKKGWFEEEGVKVSFEWMDYVASMEAYAKGEVDAVCMTNGDALVTGAGSLGDGIPARNSRCILLNDFSYGNDMVIAAAGITKFADLVGETIALEEGFVPHYLFLTGAEEEGVDPSQIQILNTTTDKTPQVLRSGAVKAIAAWQPNSGAALKAVDGATEIFSSADVPGIIFDGLFVDRARLEANRRDWEKVVKVWYRIAEFMADPKNADEQLEILSARVNMTPTEYSKLLEGTYILSLEEAVRCWGKRRSISSVYGSTQKVDDFNLKYGVYKNSEDVDSYFDPSFIKALAPAKK